MSTWRVDIENKTMDVVVVEAKNEDEALLKGQQSLYRVREKGEVKATAIEWPAVAAIDRFIPADD